MAEKKDKYLEWVEQGKLRQKLNATHILVKCDVKEADIANIIIRYFCYFFNSINKRTFFNF